jgi:hypothetical protein
MFDRCRACGKRNFLPATVLPELHFRAMVICRSVSLGLPRPRWAR